MQFVSLLGSALGDISNLKEGIIPAEQTHVVLSRVEKTLEELRELRAWVDTEWNSNCPTLYFCKGCRALTTMGNYCGECKRKHFLSGGD